MNPDQNNSMYSQNQAPQAPGPINDGMPASQPVTTAPSSGKSGGKKTGLIIGIIAAVVVIIIAAVVGYGMWWRSNAAKQYTTNAATYEKAVKSAFDFYANSKDPSSDAAQIISKFDAALAQQPKKPKLLFITATLPDGTTKHVATLTTDATNVRNGFKNLHDFNDYGTAVLKIMSTASSQGSGTLHTAADIEHLRTVLQNAVTALQALTPPKGTEQFHQQRIAAYQAMIADLDALSRALAANDTAAFNAATQKLTTDTKAASTTTAAAEINKLYDSYYDALAKNYDALATALGE